MLELKNVSKTFNPGTVNEKKALDKLSLNLNEGDFVTIIGANGAGKSTLFNAICGTFYTDEGQIILDGEDITDLSVTERAKRGISFAFQQPVHFKGLTVYDLIGLAAGKPIGINEACEYLSQVGLCARDYINREVNSSLSGGELKRIEIATVLARSAKLTIFDEPEAGIDLWSFGNLIKVFEKMHAELGGSVMIISHQERILNIADRIIVISAGSVKADGVKAAVLPALLGTLDMGCRVTAGSDKEECI